MSPQDDFEDEDNNEDQPRPRRKRPDPDLPDERQAEKAPRPRSPRKASVQAWDDAEQKVKTRSKKVRDAESDNATKSAKRKRTDQDKDKPKKVAPAKPVDRGKWRDATLGQRVTRVRWIAGLLVRNAPLVLVIILVVILVIGWMRSNTPAPVVAPFYTQEIQHWAPNIEKWSVQYGVNANLIATLMQIESCGYPGAASYVGAQGLFQVMPFNFQEGDNMTDIETNAQRGIGVLRDCLRYSDGDVGLAMACYNGGPGLISRDPNDWPTESQHYYTWGTGIYNDAVRGLARSSTLDEWLRSGGSGLCTQAASALGLPASSASPAFVAPATNVSTVPPGTQGQPGSQATFPPAPPPVIVSSPIATVTRSANGTTHAATQTPTLGIRLFLTPTNSSP